MVATRADAAYPGREQAAALAATMDKAGWAWGPSVTAALGAPAPYAETGWLTGLESWKKLAEWEEPAPRGRPGNRPVAPEEAGGRLRQLVGPGAEDRQVQRDYAAAASRAFLPREPGEPHVVLAEAGTGTGKTLGYIAPASLWAERNDAAVWLSTYTKNLQRQLDQELTRLYPDPEEKAEKIVLRKGRENYLCLLNFEEAAGRANAGVALGAGGGNPSLIPLGLIARWISATRDGDMLGGDFPSWLLPGAARAGNEGGIGLTDRRGECVYSACTHYRRCFIERAVRRSRAADIVVANHALVLTQAANAHIPDASGEPPQSEMTERVVFDEGHHVFDAADSAFAVVLSGQETSELRRWIRGAENRRSRRHALQLRLRQLNTVKAFRILLFDKGCCHIAVDEDRVIHHRAQERQVVADAFHLKAVQRHTHRLNRRITGRGPSAELGDHRVIIHADLAAFIDAGVITYRCLTRWRVAVPDVVGDHWASRDFHWWAITCQTANRR